MGRSVGPPSVVHDGRVVHKQSGSVITVLNEGGHMEHRLEQGGLTARYPIAYSVGAGMVGYSYIVRSGPYLFQSPASYYSKAKTWDLTPGYENMAEVDFTHPVTEGCLFCHTGSLNRIAGNPNQFAPVPFTPISCDRCHGPSAEHLKRPSAANIVNPAKLPTARRDSVCEQCHLEGAVRVLNPDRDWWDFHAGESAESTFVTYISHNSSTSTVHAVSQSELLERSQCIRKSGGQLWCGSCHAPHVNSTKVAATVTQTCLSCHQALFTANNHEPETQCVSCHMPKLNASNVAHSAVTDHSIPRITRKQAVEPSKGKAEVSVAELRVWRAPAPELVDRDLGVAAFEVAATNKAPADILRSYSLLSQLPAPKRLDPVVEADLASILLGENHIDIAVQLFSQATHQQPSNARYFYCLGVAFERQGKLAEAEKMLQRSIQLDPSQQDPYFALSELYRKAGRKAESRNALAEYLRVLPQDIELRSILEGGKATAHAD